MTLRIQASMSKKVLIMASDFKNRFLGRVLVALVTILAISFVTTGCSSPYYRDRGATLGGLTGAGIGAAIGSANDETLAGTLIGGTVGALSGAMVGDSLDDVYDRNQRSIAAANYDRRAQGAATMRDTISMTRAGLSDDVIIQHLQVNGLVSNLTTNDLIEMKQQGVSESVIRYMQGMSGPPSSIATASYAAPPMVIEEHIYGPRPFPPMPRHAYPGPYLRARRYVQACRPRPAFGWSVGVHH